MKKILLIFIFLFCITGCDKGEEITCTIDNQKAVFTMKNGIITSYTLDNKTKSQSEIDELNGTYFTSSTNNEEGKEALQNYVNSQNGSCNW